MSAPRVAIVGGGITGLAVAWFLRQARPDLDLVVLDAGRGSQFRRRPRPGFLRP